MDNEVKEEVKVEPKKKSNGLFTLFACVMTGIIVFLATNIGQKASKTVDPDTPKKNEVTSNVESNTTSNVESNVNSNSNSTEITEVEKSSVNEKMVLLFGGSEIENNVINASHFSNIWEGLFTGKYDEKFFLQTVIASIKSNDYVSYTAKDGEISKQEKDQILTNMNGGIKAIPASKVETLYKKLLGKDITKHQNVSLACPIFAYDSKYKMYVEVPGCGGSTSAGQKVSLDSYTKNENLITVHTRVLNYFCDGSEECVVYSGYGDNSKVFANTKEEKNVKFDSKFEKAALKYDFVFEKSTDGNYYFKSVTKAN